MCIPKTTDEAKRISELEEYNILDTLTEKEYEDITYIASVICDVPIALISFVDKDRQWYKSHLGVLDSETPREYSFCSQAIKSNDAIMIVEDSREDKRFQNNPLVTGNPNIVFYAGVPLVNHAGFGLGTVCVIDRKKRTLTEHQVKALKVLSGQVMNLLELRKVNYQLEQLKRVLEAQNKELEEFAMIVSHDIKSPLTTVLLANKMIGSQFQRELGNEGKKLLNYSNNSVEKIKSLLDGILSYYKNEQHSSTYESIHLASFFKNIENAISTQKKYQLIYQGNEEDNLFFNETQLEQIFLNLISNSIRYNDNDMPIIKIEFHDQKKYYEFIYSDNGIGIAKENFDRIFKLFTTVAETDRSGFKGSGIGLATIKKIVESSGGTIRLNSTLGEGTQFIFTLKKITKPQ
ncbi:MAG TPA: GAF domain-containing sensor histidine kinase [Hanamia sp.]